MATIPPIPSVPLIPNTILPPDELSDKKQFAAYFLKQEDASKAALMLFPSNVGKALRVAQEWPNDPDVKDEMIRLQEEYGPGGFQPTREDIAADIWRRAKAALTVEDYERLMKLYCNVRGFIEKPGSAPITVAVQSVMVVPSQGSDQNWEQNAARSQRHLIEANRD